MSYPLRMVVVALALNLIVGAIAWFSLENSRERYTENAVTATQNLSDLVVHEVGAKYENTDHNLLDVANEFARQTVGGHSDFSRLEDLIRRHLSQHPELIAIQIVNLDGEAILGGGGQKPSADSKISDQDYFARHRDRSDQGLIISEPLIGKISGKPELVFSRRLSDRDGQFAGVVLAYFSMDQIEARIARLKLGALGFSAVRDSKNRLLARYPRPEGASGKTGAAIFSTELAEALRRHPESGTYVSGTTTVDGFPRLASYRRHEQFPFYVVVGIGQADYLLPWRNEIVRTAGIVLFFLLASLVGVGSLLVSWRRREQAVKALEASERRFAEIFNSVNDAVFIYEAATAKILDLNRRACEMYGFSREELLESGEINPCHSGESGEHESAIERIRSALTDGPQTFECQAKSKDGQLFWVEISLRQAQIGDRTCVLAVARNIGERKSIIAELEKHKLHLQQLVQERTAELQAVNELLGHTQFAMERVGIGIHWVDTVTGRYLYANNYAAELLGYTVDEFLHLSVQEITPQYHSEESFRQVIQEIYRQGSLQIEAQERAKNGELIPVKLAVYYLPGEAGREGRLISFVTDIRQRKEVERALLCAKEAAESANLAKSSFMARMSHELRTPLNAILGFSQLMAKDVRISEEHRQQLAIINRSGEHLLSMINDVLDLSKIEAGKMDLSLGVVDLHYLCREVVALMTSRAEEKSLFLKLFIDGDVPQHIRSDETKLRQILLNLLGNAVKFTLSGGANLLVSVPRPGCLRLAVSDTGSGIAKEDQEAMFEPFVQGKNLSHIKGTGLGLAISRKMTEILGGRLGVDSDLGRGACFWAELPLEAVDSPVPPTWNAGLGEEEVLNPEGGAWRVLVAEDDESSQVFIRDLLESLRMEVRVAANGAEAWQLFQEWSPHLVLMDIRMPILDGIQATRKIRSLPEGANVPILALTAGVFREEQLAVLEAGCNGVLPKPVKVEQLLAKIRSLLLQERRVKGGMGREPGEGDGPSAQEPALPEALRQAMTEAARRLDGDALAALCPELEQLSPRRAQKIRQLLLRYDFGGIIHQIDNGMNPVAGRRDE